MGYSSHFFLLFLAEDAQLTPLLRLGAGACAGIIAMSATYPMDMVRGRLTVQVLSSFLIKEIIFSKMSWILFIFEYMGAVTSISTLLQFPLIWYHVLADRKLTLSVQRNVSCSINSAPTRRTTGFVQGLASFCHWSCKLTLCICFIYPWLMIIVMIIASKHYALPISCHTWLNGWFIIHKVKVWRIGTSINESLHVIEAMKDKKQRGQTYCYSYFHVKLVHLLWILFFCFLKIC